VRYKVTLVRRKGHEGSLPVLVEASKYKTRKKRLKRTSVRDGEDRHATCVRLNSDVLTILKFLIFVSTIGCIITGLSAAEHHWRRRVR
jgi:hypothetical protein